ncbi:hypothetical protein H257_00190 [Aphanomyces astaci]|uniref:HSF-type DNA-binding domain-containing protein n=1 Tax=Aphanomyces astaci TaxID=112090 RepID=W4HBL7_APHAT|nr:hypothetical protein H257_00190 [Aphanomyces astaci]ETV88654.1 hypothetical protein H257_00190 [Aphanomyces astaci]|eukprot:XP_009821054.1 hypothetical protein H257_00190 [Aphanomyces astaci]
MSNNKTRTTGVPKFLRHLYAILHTEDSSIMSWSMDGMCIQLFNVKRLEAEVRHGDSMLGLNRRVYMYSTL